MKKLLTIFMLFVYFVSFSQGKLRKDTLVNNGVYESFYSFLFGQPLYVKYKLYKGGGECSRKDESFHFKKDSILPNPSAGANDYAGSGYDEGHMANAEDFAYDCNKEEATFRYYNCIPQTVALNRAVWRKHESKVRKASQTDSLLIFCGGIFTTKSKYVKESSRLKVPTQCFKVVISLTTHKVVNCVIFDNNDDPQEKNVPLTEVQYKTHFFFDRLAKFSITE